jgi:hypothetical protein
MLPGEAGEGATVDPERGGAGDDAAGDRAQGSGPAAIPQQGAFADDRAWAESADVNPDAEHTVEKKVDVVAGWPCSVSSAPLAILPIAGLLPPRVILADNSPFKGAIRDGHPRFRVLLPPGPVYAERGALPVVE